jgi:hypothetical protein
MVVLRMACVDGVADVVRDCADDAPDSFLAAPDSGEVVVELAPWCG